MSDETKARVTTVDQAEALDRLATVVSNAATDRIEAQIPVLIRKLEGAGIDVIVLKGPVTRHRLYVPAERRPTADIDIMVDPARFSRAARLLMADGFRRYDRHGHSDAFTADGDPDRADVDLHLTLPYVTVAPRRAFEILRAHRDTLDIDATPVPVLDDPAHAVHLAIHAAVNAFDPTHRSLDEWRRATERLGPDRMDGARDVAVSLGVGPVWDLACRALESGALPAGLVAELPVWEAVPRIGSVMGFFRSGTPVRVKVRDVDRLVALQLSDDTLNVWRAKRGKAPLESGSWQMWIAKPVRLVAVGSRGLGRLAQGAWGHRGRDDRVA